MIAEPPVSAPLRVSGKLFRLGDSGSVCFIKAVTFGPFPLGVFPGGEVRIELERIKDELGANAVRFFEPPPIHWLNDCADLGLLAFITISWSQHIDFLNQRNIRRDTEIRVKEIVGRYRGHPAVAAFYIGNEIESSLVRYLGPRRVVRFLESLIDLGRVKNPHVLFSYANYPTTEFLIPENQDFLAFNVYLEDRDTFSRYLDRLQSLAGNRPVLISEFGVDSKKFGPGAQAEQLCWHIEEGCKAGIAGTTIFSWSDQWSRGGETITGWDFGLTDRAGRSKEALHQVASKWQLIQKPFDGVSLEAKPRFSIVICTYKGAAPIAGALHSMTRLDYPDYEIIVVNDGNDDKVRDLVQPMDDVRHVGVPHGGLSNARNIGARIATGDIIVYTDDDCLVDPDWLNWLALAFSSPDRPDCVGGPNIPPPALNVEQACVIAAPGAPSHVLIADRIAEHVPGCNLAVKKLAFDAIGGFDIQFRTAGDDVDFCWRLLEAGYKIGFHGGAFVWHLRRSSFRAYLRQQKGYGRAEAMLKTVHKEKFSAFGGAIWKGFVYDGPPLSFSRSSEIIYHGEFGCEPYQLIYPDFRRGYSSIFTHAAYILPLVILIPFGLINPWIGLIPVFGLYFTLSTLLKTAFQADIQREFDSLWTRLALARIVLAQGFLRSAERTIRSGLNQRPIGFIKGIFMTIFPKRSGLPGNSLTMKFWNDYEIGRETLLKGIKNRHSPDENGQIDIKLSRGLFFNADLITVTEYHEKSGCLTRARIVFNFKIMTFLVGMVAILLVGDLISNPIWIPCGYLGLAMLEWVFFAFYLTHLVGSAARRVGLKLLKK